ncbi:alpha/beta hydrolase domain-containing protein [Ralstonia pseudosolanacearum]
MAERYETQSGYVAAVTAAADDLVARRFLLQADARAAVAKAIGNPELPQEEQCAGRLRKRVRAEPVLP